MEINTKEEFKNLENELNTNENLKEKFPMKKANKCRLKMFIHGTNEMRELVKSLESQNEAISEDKIKVEFRTKTQRERNTIVNLEPVSFPQFVTRLNCYRQVKLCYVV